MTKASVICNEHLSSSQQQIANKIARYGLNNGYSDHEIEIAIKTAFIESSLGNSRENEDSSASGLFGYTDGRWKSHGNLGDKRSR